MTTRITTSNIETATLAQLGGPKITNIEITDSSYTVLDDTAVDIAGGYILVTGTGFESGCQVVVNNTPAASATYISSTQVRAQLPATAAGTYIVYLINPTGGVAIRVNGITFSATPAWTTASTLPTGDSGSAISIQLAAEGASTYSLAAGSTLPGSVTLTSAGLLSGVVSGLENETTYNFTVLATDTELQDSPRTFSITITAGDPLFAATTLLLPGSAETFVRDASATNFTVSIAGDVRPNTFNPYLTGWSNYFDGTGDWITTPNVSAFNLSSSTTDFTIEGWVYRQSTAYNGIVGARQNNTGSGWCLYIGTNGTFYTGSVIEGNAYADRQLNTTVIPVNTWAHFALVKTATGYTAYINGVGGAELALTGGFNYQSGQPLIVGALGSQGEYPFTGHISNLRIVKGTALYTANFTPSTTPLTAIAGTSLLTCQSNRFADNSVNNFAITHTGDVKVQSFSPFVEPATTRGSTYFDGSDYLSLANNDAFNCGTGDFTLETWYYHDGGTALYPSIFSSTDWATGTGGVGLRFNNTGMANKFGFFWYGVGDPFLTASFTSAPYAWHHVAVTRLGNTFTLWVDGVSAATGTASGTVNFNLSTGGPRIGWGPWDGSNGYLKAYLNNLRLVKGTALYTTAFTPSTTPLTAVAGTSLLTLQNNTPANNHSFVDASSSNLLITRNGNATQGTFSPYSPAGWSNSFDGTGDFLSVPNNSSLDLGSGDYTIEGWWYFTDTSNQAMVSKYTGSNGYVVQYHANNLRMVLGLGSSDAVYSFAWTAIPNTWNHVAITRSGTSGRAFINGAQIGSTTTFTTSNTVGATTLQIGLTHTVSELTRGYVSNFRLVKGTALYTANFTPSTTPLTAIAGTSLLTCQSPQFADLSPNRLTITRNGDVRVQNFAPFRAQVQTPVTHSAYFDGTGDYLTVPNNNAFKFGSENFTIECWVYFNAVSNNDIISKWNAGGTAGTNQWLLYTSSAVPRFIWSIDGSATAGTAIGTTLVANRWYHLAAVRNGSSITLYVDGVGGTPVSVSGSLYGSETEVLGISYRRNNGSTQTPINGYVSNVRLVKGTAVYTTDFTPSTTPLTAIANTSLLTCQSPTFIDNSANQFAITAAGNAQPVTVNPFGSTSANSTGYTASEYSGSMYFDGTGDSLVVPANPLTYFSSLPFTMEAWVYPNASNGIIAGRRAAVAARGFLFAYQSNSTFSFWAGDTDVNTWNLQLNSPTAYPLNQWYHVAVTRNDSNVFTLWVNGVSVASATASFAIADDTTNLQIGILDTAGSPFNGYISNLRIAKGNLLYTSNFAPPIAPVQPIPNTVLLLNGTAAAITDATTKNVLETVGDARISTAVSKWGGSSMSFDGTGDCLLSARPDIIPASGDFTIECWVYCNVTGIRHDIVNQHIDGTVGRINLNIDANNKATLFQGSTPSNFDIVGSTNIVANQWYHLAATRNGATFRLFVDGTLQGTTTSSQAVLQTPMRIGAILGGTTLLYPFNGYIQDFRVTQGVARYTANFTPPATAFRVR